MKTLKIFILAMSLLVGGQIHANMKENTESWLQKGPSNAGGGLIGPGESSDGTLTPLAPVHDGVYVLLALAGAYILVRNRKRTAEKN
ncbi:MAG: hypothetical protein LBI82_02735 [Dysgonamonadaceae bacterium]|jgi:hypothetical protein|nr:hypothetical protein [Dysgonamonadaceae bacterium]